MTNLIGQSLGRYHILEQLGEGGMATVYKAYDTRLETDVAVKVIRTENILPSVLERSLKRFEREAKSLARLTHPNIVKVTDYGEFEGKPYLVMEYLPGGTLKDRIKQGPIPWQEAVRLLLPIAQALEFAHEKNIIHRDVKPSNILLTEKGQPMLTDFGIAKLFDMDSTADLTGTGMGVGTPEYMAPEQWQGQVSVQTDVYALGVVLYEMVTGRKPYTANTPAALLIKQASEPLPRPRNFMPGLSDNAEEALLKALAKRKENRYQSMAEMAAAFEGLTAGRQHSENPLPTLPTLQASRTRPEKNLLPIKPQKPRSVHVREAKHNTPKKSYWENIIAIGLTILILITFGTLGIELLNSQSTQQATTTAREIQMNAEAAVKAYFQATETERARQIEATGTQQAYQTQTAATAQAHQTQAAATEQILNAQKTATAQACANLIKIAINDTWRTFFCDQFNNNDKGWELGNIDNDYYIGNLNISNGKLLWNVIQTKQGSLDYRWPNGTDVLNNFYASVDVQRVNGPKASACYGLTLRGNGVDYYFQLCDSKKFQILLHSEKSGWVTLADWKSSSAINPNQTNKLILIVQGGHFDFLINDQVVKSLDNQTWSGGLVGLLVGLSDGDSDAFEFDNLVITKP